MNDNQIRRILVCGATGKQGGAVIRALIENPPSFDHEILALTRNTNSPSAKRLADLPRVNLIGGNLEDVDAIFAQAGGPGSIWAVFSVQVPEHVKSNETQDREVRQGKALIDGAITNDVKHFVYTSVERHGEESFNTPTQIPHFISKHEIEHYLVDQVANSEMTYTILRPVAFMDGMQPNLFGRIFAGMWAQMGDIKLQLVATRDIGIIAAQALSNPELDEYKNTGISLAGDELTQAEANEIFWSVLGRPQVQNQFLGSIVQWMVPDVGLMFQWFKDPGYAADINKCRKLNPQMRDLATWLKEDSSFKR